MTDPYPGDNAPTLLDYLTIGVAAAVCLAILAAVIVCSRW